MLRIRDLSHQQKPVMVRTIGQPNSPMYYEGTIIDFDDYWIHLKSPARGDECLIPIAAIAAIEIVDTASQETRRPPVV